MAYSTAQIEEAIRGIVEARDFLRERASSFVTREELDRLTDAVRQNMGTLDEVRRRPIFGGAETVDRQR